MTIERKRNFREKRNKTFAIWKENEKLYQQLFTTLPFDLKTFPFFFAFLEKKEKVFRFDVKSQHKEGLYHCEFMCLDIFSLFSLLCALPEMTTRKEKRMFYQVAKFSLL